MIHKQIPPAPLFYPQGVRRWVPRCSAATLPQPEGGTYYRRPVRSPPLKKGGRGDLLSCHLLRFLTICITLTLSTSTTHPAGCASRGCSRARAGRRAPLNCAGHFLPVRTPDCSARFASVA